MYILSRVNKADKNSIPSPSMFIEYSEDFINDHFPVIGFERDLVCLYIGHLLGELQAGIDVFQQNQSPRMIQIKSLDDIPEDIPEELKTLIKESILQIQSKMEESNEEEIIHPKDSSTTKIAGFDINLN
jgi:hypothetical protein